MHNAQVVKSRIKSRCIFLGIDLKKLLSDCGLGINAINQITDNKGIGSAALCRMADYLCCSTDFLLGRTDNPEVNK